MEDRPLEPKLEEDFCGAKTRCGELCMETPMKNGRCRLHGGLSTGPKTPEGRARCGNWKHGEFSRIAQARRKLIKELCSHQK